MANELELFRGFPTEFRDLFGMSRRLNRFFDDFFEGMPMTSQGPQKNDLAPRSGLQESDEQFLLSFEIPGVPKDNIQVEVTGNRLHIFGEKRSEGKGKKGEAEREEYARYEQYLVLPEAVDPSKVEAEYKDGILYVAVPKSEAQKTKRVEIGSGEKGLLSRIKGKAERALGGKTEEPRTEQRKAEKAA